MLLCLLPALLAHRMIPSNIVLAFCVFTLVVVATIGCYWVSLENFILWPRHLKFIRKHLIGFLLQTTLKVIQECIGSCYCHSRKEKGGRNDFCDQQEDLQRSSLFVQSSESERQNIQAGMWVTTAQFYTFYDWKLQNPIDSIVALKKKTKPSLSTVPVWDIWHRFAILGNSWTVLFETSLSVAFKTQRPVKSS